MGGGSPIGIGDRSLVYASWARLAGCATNRRLADEEDAFHVHSGHAVKIRFGRAEDRADVPHAGDVGNCTRREHTWPQACRARPGRRWADGRHWADGAEAAGGCSGGSAAHKLAHRPQADPLL